MKKSLSIFMIFAVVMGVLCLTACSGNEEDVAYLCFYQENVDFATKTTDKDNKTAQYELKTTYGTTIDVNDFEIQREVQNMGSFKVDKNDYTFENGLPTAQNVGTYTLTFRYDVWTFVVDVIIEKQTVVLPHWDSTVREYYDGVKYDGRDYTNRISYDPNALEMLEPNLERIEPKEFTGDGASDKYYVEFILRNEDNYKWPENCGVDSETGKYTFEFAIKKELLEVGLYEYVINSDERYQFQEGWVTPEIRYSASEVSYPVAFSVNESEISGILEYIDIEIYKNYPKSDEIVSEITGPGTYYLTLSVKDAAHYELIATTEKGNIYAFIGNPDSYIAVAMLVIQ